MGAATTIILASEGPAASPASARTVNAAGQPVQRFTKDLIRTGNWMMPGQGVKFEVTPARLSQWAATFNRMAAAGVSVPVMLGHTDDPDKSRGRMVEAWVDGDTLYATLEAVGADAILAFARNEVSIYAPPTFTDGKGNQYRDAITHVALTPVPVISGQDEFVVAASLGGSKVPVLRLAKELPNMDLKKLAADMGITVEGLDDAKIMEAIKAKVAAMEASLTAATGNAATAEAAVAASRSELAAFKASVAAPAKPDTLTLSLAGENRGLKLDGLVNAGKITPAVRAKLAAAWNPADEGALALSLTPDANRLFTATLAALAENDPRVLGEQSKAQALALSRLVPGSTTTDAKDDAALITRMGGKPANA